MSASVRISMKVARQLEADAGNVWADRGAIGELSAAIFRAERASTRRIVAKKPKEAKRKAKREETSEIREAVMNRARGNCEACGRPCSEVSPLEMDHFFGRAKTQQTTMNCWALCHGCHLDKTNNHPSSAWWLSRFYGHAEWHGYWDVAKRAKRRLAFVNARGGK